MPSTKVPNSRLPARIRMRYVIRGKLWRVKFKRYPKPASKSSDMTYGEVRWSERTIYINETLKKFPFSLHETLNHELLHVYYASRQRPGVEHPRYSLGHNNLAYLVTKIERAKRTGIL